MATDVAGASAAEGIGEGIASREPLVNRVHWIRCEGTAGLLCLLRLHDHLSYLSTHLVLCPCPFKRGHHMTFRRTQCVLATRLSRLWATGPWQAEVTRGNAKPPERSVLDAASEIDMVECAAELVHGRVYER